jgi:glycosyltransferase involved in cell wall biosynthesis
MSAAVLAVYMEPAPYLTGLVRELRTAWNGRLDVLFIGRNLTQTWAEQPDQPTLDFLPENKLAALRQIGRQLRHSRYDLVHVAGWGHPVLMGAIILGALKNLPIISETDTQTPAREARWRRFAKMLIYPALFSLPRTFLPAGSRQAAYLKKYRVQDQSMRRGKMTVDVSQIVGFAGRYSADQKAMYRKGLGISDSVRTVFLYLGRLEDFKGIQDLFDAYMRLRTQRDDVALVIGGSGSLEGFVRDAADSLRSVHYLGHLTGDAVWEAYCAADVLVLPSRREPWGLVVNEAMAAGLPVIATDVVGCVDDLVRQDVTGLIVPAREPRFLNSAMSKIAANPAHRAKMGAEAKNLISDWTLAEEARIITSVWQEALS